MNYRIDKQAAYVIHTRPYRDTSALVDLFSLEYGKMTVVSRGMRRPNSKLRSTLQSFVPLQVSWQGRNDLKTLTAAESTGYLGLISGNALICGLYANELLQKLLPIQDSYPKLFVYYQYLLNSLIKQDIEIPLRIFERKLISELGYSIDCASVDVNTNYYLNVEKLVLEKLVTIEGIDKAHCFTGEQLLAINKDDYLTLNVQRAAKRFMRIQINNLLGDKELNSRSLFKSKLIK